MGVGTRQADPRRSCSPGGAGWLRWRSQRENTRPAPLGNSDTPAAMGTPNTPNLGSNPIVQGEALGSWENSQLQGQQRFGVGQGHTQTGHRAESGTVCL